MRREVTTEIAGSIWAHVAGVGQRVSAGEPLLVVEVMKTEFAVVAPVDGEVTWLKPCAETVEAGDVVAMLEDA